MVQPLLVKPTRDSDIFKKIWYTHPPPSGGVFGTFPKKIHHTAHNDTNQDNYV